MTASLRAGAVACVLVSLLLGCSAEPPAASADIPADAGPPVVDPVIEVADNVYEPATVTVAVGTEVTWRWVGRVAHDVVGDGFDSTVLVEGEFSHTFETSGVFPYVCRLHPGMEGEVIVVP
jgi:plastocyanin